MPFYLHKNEPLAPGLRRIASEQIGYALSEIADDEIPVHRMVHALRTRCKKLRGLLRLTKPVMSDSFQLEDQRYRAAARELAGSRDMEVRAKTIALLNGPAEKSEISHREVSEEAIERSREILAECLDSVEAWSLDLHGFYDIAPGFARTYWKCRDAWNTVLQEYSDEGFHRLRRWTKYHWYQIRILERLNKQELRKRREKLRKLQLVLGDAHDLVLLQAYLEADVDTDTPLLQRAISRKNELYADAINIGQEVFVVRVSELVADCSRYWADRGY